MSQVSGQLDLSGINIQTFTSKRQARPGVKQKFQISPNPGVITESQSFCSSKFLFILVLSFLLIAAILTFLQSSKTTNTNINSHHIKQLNVNLRKIIRMQCMHDTSTHCTTKYEGGEYVVNIGSCTIYDFNGIPFTDIFRDTKNNFHVPPSNEMTLIVNKACDKIVATFDTNTKYLNEYAHKNAQGINIKKIVWIPSKNCYTEFNLKIGKYDILEKTPAAMINQKELNGVTAYTYIATGKIQGSISVTGEGCEVPIHIYSLKT